jgi:hypothetical protein
MGPGEPVRVLLPPMAPFTQEDSALRTDLSLEAKGVREVGPTVLRTLYRWPAASGDEGCEVPGTRVPDSARSTTGTRRERSPTAEVPR